jgi:hypothetical protein
VSKVPEWAGRISTDILDEACLTQLQHEQGVYSALKDNFALALVAAEKRGIERAAKIADEALAMRARLFDENGASLNASKAVQAEELAAAIRQLGDRHD